MVSSAPPNRLAKFYIEGFSSTDAALTKFAYFRITYAPQEPRMNVAKYSKDNKIYAAANIPMTQSENIDMLLKVRKNGKEYYKMQYRDNHKELRIRCDNKHGTPHIDIEWPGEKQNKTWLTDTPKNYEEAIDLILINAEQNNPIIGAYYWLVSPMSSHKDDKAHVLEGLKYHYGIQTHLTLLARVAALRLMNETAKAGGKSLDAQSILEKVCKDIRRQEKEEGGPLKIENILYRGDIVLYPFPISVPSGASAVFEEFPSGNDMSRKLFGVGFIP
jgi:hypothetical protein